MSLRYESPKGANVNKGQVTKSSLSHLCVLKGKSVKKKIKSIFALLQFDS